MKHFNRRSAVPMVTMAQSTEYWRNTHTHVDRTHSLTHTINTVTLLTTTWSVAPAQLLHNSESNFFFEGTWGTGSKPECPEKNPNRLVFVSRCDIMFVKVQVLTDLTISRYSTFHRHPNIIIITHQTARERQHTLQRVCLCLCVCVLET